MKNDNKTDKDLPFGKWIAPAGYVEEQIQYMKGKRKGTSKGKEKSKSKKAKTKSPPTTPDENRSDSTPSPDMSRTHTFGGYTTTIDADTAPRENVREPLQHDVSGVISKWCPVLTCRHTHTHTHTHRHTHTYIYDVHMF